MNRRGFLAGLGALVGGIALEQAIPFNRVWSFPKEIKIAPPIIASPLLDLDVINLATRRYIMNNPSLVDNVFVNDPILVNLRLPNLSGEVEYDSFGKIA